MWREAKLGDARHWTKVLRDAIFWLDRSSLCGSLMHVALFEGVQAFTALQPVEPMADVACLVSHARIPDPQTERVRLDPVMVSSCTGEH